MYLFASCIEISFYLNYLRSHSFTYIIIVIISLGLGETE